MKNLALFIFLVIITTVDRNSNSKFVYKRHSNCLSLQIILQFVMRYLCLATFSDISYTFFTFLHFFLANAPTSCCLLLYVRLFT